MVANHIIVCLLLFVYNMSNVSLYCVSCIICLNEIYFICVLARKPESPIVLVVNCGLLKTHIPSGEPTTHRDKDYHDYTMVVHRNKLYRSNQCGALGITSWEV